MDEAKLGKKEREIASLEQVLLDLRGKMEEERAKTSELHAGLDVEAENFQVSFKVCYEL